jgi:hypothetical protein
MPPDGFVRDSESHEDLRQVKAQTVDAKPSFVWLEAQLPKQDLTDMPVAASRTCESG